MHRLIAATFLCLARADSGGAGSSRRVAGADVRQVEFGLRRDPRGAAGTFQGQVWREGGARQQAHHQLQKGEDPSVRLKNRDQFGFCLLLYFKFLLVINGLFPSPLIHICKCESFGQTPKYMQMCVRGKINDVTECEEWALD